MKLYTRPVNPVSKTSVKPLTWDDIKEGDEITPLSYQESAERMTDFGLYYMDFFSWHVTQMVGKKSPFSGKVAQGILAEGFVQQLVTNWLGSPSSLLYGGAQDTKLTRPIFVGDVITGSGKVREKKVDEEGIRYVYCDVSLRNQKDEVCLVGEVRLCFGQEE